MSNINNKLKTERNNNFYDLISESEKEAPNSNISITENGMYGFKTTYHPMLDTFYALTSFRNENDAKIKEAIKTIIESEDSKYLLKFLFLTRDAREGSGERRFFRVALKELLKYEFQDKEEIVSLIINELMQEYGRFDDLLIFLGTPYEGILVNKIKSQLKLDVESIKENKPISLLAKWLPSENTSSIKTRQLARKLIKSLNVTPKEYRKTLSFLREQLKVVEVLMSEKRFNEINYSNVPSKANLRYSSAFLAKDYDRRNEFLELLMQGDSSVHINSSVTFPHEILTKLRMEGASDTLELLWKNLKQIGLENTIVVRDGSGSMTQTITNTNTTCLDVATALSIYCAEHMKGEFKNKFITFSMRPKLVTLPGTSLLENFKECIEYTECANTNIEAVFKLILNTAKTNNLTQEELPKQILIISDMEFDYCAENANQSVFVNMQEKFQENGYTMPKLAFWNVCSRTKTIPVLVNENGVALISGFSVNTLKMVMSEEMAPFKILLEIINDTRYERVPFIVNASLRKTIIPGDCSKKDYNPSWL